MTQTQAMIWFISTTVFVVLLLVGGVYEGTHAYDEHKPRRHWLPHRHH